MERQFVHCEHCNDLMEAEYYKGRWTCENCGSDLTEEVNYKLEQENKRKYEKK